MTNIPNNPTPDFAAHVAQRCRADAVRQLLEMCDRPDLARSPLAYLLLNDGSLVVANFCRGVLSGHLCEQLPPLAVDLGELPLKLTTASGAATSGALLEKPLATELYHVMAAAFGHPES